jgi:lia operon protein LiaF
MRRSEIIYGSIILGVGVLLLIGAIFNLNIWGILCPSGLIALGVWLIYRTRKDPREGDLDIKFVGDVRREGAWEAMSNETWGFVLDSRLDFSEADLPTGQTVFRVVAFVNDFKVIIPDNVGIAVNSMAFMTESKIQGEKQETFFIPYSWESENFDTASQKILLKPTCFVSEIKVDQVGIQAKKG